jgi:hypothetical protein
MLKLNRDVGGSAIVFTAVKNFIFGKTLKTVEYPTGNLKTIAIRFATINSVKKGIASVNGIDDHMDIKQVYKWYVLPTIVIFITTDREDNYWTEQLITSADIRNMNDFAWIIWTRSYGKLPTKGVNLKEINTEAEQLLAASQKGVVVDGTPTPTSMPTSTASIGSAIPTATGTTDHTLVRTASGKYVDKHILEQAQLHSKNVVKLNAIKLITQCRNPELGANAFTEEEAQAIMDLVLKDDSYIISLYSNFKDDPLTFAKYCKKKANELKQQVQNVEEKYKQLLKSEQTELEKQLDKLEKNKQNKQEKEEKENLKREEGIRNLVHKVENEIREKTEPTSGPGQKPPVNTSSTETTKSGAVATF